MFRLTVLEGDAPGETVVAISGAAVFTDARELQRALEELLIGCDRLTIDIGRLTGLDLVFHAVLCSLHRSCGLRRKSIALRGAPAGLEDAFRLGALRCPFREAEACCRLWEEAPREPACASGALGEGAPSSPGAARA